MILAAKTLIWLLETPKKRSNRGKWWVGGKMMKDQGCKCWLCTCALLFTRVAKLLYRCMSSLQSCYASVIYCKSAYVSCCEKLHYLVLTFKTVVLLSKQMYQPSLEIYVSLAFTNSVKGLYLFAIKSILHWPYLTFLNSLNI